MSQVVPKTVARYIKTNTDLIYIRKPAWSQHVQEEIDRLSAESYNWHVAGRHPLIEAEFHNGYQKTASVYQPNLGFVAPYINEIFNSAWNEFLLLDPSAKIIEIVRGLISLSNNRSNMIDASIHRDSFSTNTWSFLVHIKGTSGTTEFFDSDANTSVIMSTDFEPGKITMFPSLYSHQGHLPDDDNDRFIMNFIVKIDTVLNNRVFDTSPTMVQKSIEHLSL